MFNFRLLQRTVVMATAVFSLSFAATALAQDPALTPNQKPAKPTQDDARPEKPKPEKEAKPGDRDDERGERAKGDKEKSDDAAGHMNSRAAQKKILLEEAKYRKQLARINRLRELATQQNNQERLAALDKLEAKMTELHDRKIAAAKSALNPDDAKKISDEIQKGRGHAKGKDKEKGNSKGRSDDRAGGKPDANADHGRGNAGRSDGNDDNTSDRGRKPDDSKREDHGKPDKPGKPDNAGSGKGHGKP